MQIDVSFDWKRIQKRDKVGDVGGTQKGEEGRKAKKREWCISVCLSRTTP